MTFKKRFYKVLAEALTPGSSRPSGVSAPDDTPKLDGPSNVREKSLNDEDGKLLEQAAPARTPEKQFC